MLVKLDEILSRSHAAFLRDQGHDADRVHDQGLSGASDAQVWERVKAEGRFLITLDLDFSDLRHDPPGTLPGILLLRARSNGRGAGMGVLQRVLKERSLESLKGCLAVATEEHTRIRRG